MTVSSPKPKFYTMQEVAALFKVPRATINRWHRTRPDFPRKVLIGENAVRFLVDEIDRPSSKIFRVPPTTRTDP